MTGNLVPRTIAVVDDDASVRKSLGRLLRGAGFGVEAFASAEDYLAREGTCPPDCLVLDISLGGMSGLDLRDSLARSGSTVPIVFITAHDDPAMLRALPDGARTPCLRKPFDESLLFEAISNLLGEGPSN
jgi:FixJ family two-component response regulator